MNIGKTNTLKIVRFTPPGAFLKDEKGDEVLLPTKYIPHKSKVDDELEVFIYRDSEDRMIATTLTPHLQLNEFLWE